MNHKNQTVIHLKRNQLNNELIQLKGTLDTIELHEKQGYLYTYPLSKKDISNRIAEIKKELNLLNKRVKFYGKRK